MGWLTAAELVTKTRYSEAVQQQVAAALDAPAGADRDAACLAALTEAEKELRCDSGKVINKDIDEERLGPATAAAPPPLRLLLHLRLQLPLLSSRRLPRV